MERDVSGLEHINSNSSEVSTHPPGFPFHDLVQLFPELANSELNPSTFQFKSNPQPNEPSQNIRPVKNKQAYLEKLKKSKWDLHSSSRAFLAPKRTRGFEERFEMAVVPEGYPFVKLTKEQGEDVHEALIKNLLSLESDNFPIFNRSFIKRGLVILSCANLETRTWLENVVPSLKPWDEPMLVVGECQLFLKGIEMTFRTPKQLPKTETSKIMDMLDSQNTNLRVKEWIVTSSIDLGTGQRINFEVDKAAFSAILDAKHQACLGLWQVYLDIVKKDDPLSSYSKNKSQTQKDESLNKHKRPDFNHSQSSFNKSKHRTQRLESWNQPKRPVSNEYYSRTNSLLNNPISNYFDISRVNRNRYNPMGTSLSSRPASQHHATGGFVSNQFNKKHNNNSFSWKQVKNFNYRNRSDPLRHRPYNNSSKMADQMSRFNCNYLDDY